MDLVEETYLVTRGFPKEETFGLTSQMRRASISVPANIAEGSARKSASERSQFYFIARASLSEFETHLEIARRLKFIQEDRAVQIRGTCGRIAAMINGMIKK